jgi:hypothetical protein
VHIRKKKISAHRQLLPRRDSPFQILEHINDNAFKLALPSEYNVNATFNVYDFSFLCI